MKISFEALSAKSAALPKTDTLVFFLCEKKILSDLAQALDAKLGGIMAQTLSISKFSGKRAQTLAIPLPKGAPALRAMLVGIGKDRPNPLEAEKIGGAVCAALNALGAKSAVAVVEATDRDIPGFASRLASGALLRSYRFDKYHTKKKEEDKPTLGALTVLTPDAKTAQAAFAPLAALADGVFFTRDLVSEPANIIHPESLAEACQELTRFGVDVGVLGEEEMYALGMHALLGVGQGSAKESQLVVMRWNGAGKKDKAGPLAFVGKGVCFDTGGISIKPANGMEEMKWDMAGAGVVIGLMRALASRKAKVNVVGVVGLVENMPGGNAQRPGDVVTSMSGQTIEVLNTDAEGRLVLSDALWYTQENYKPRLIVDLATLTGAIIVALGTSRAGLFSNDDTLSDQLTAAGLAVGEPLWRLPLGEEYDKQIDSDIADMQNIGKDREAGSITAAQFLQRFIKPGTPWAHLDIAGTAWSKKDSELAAKGATAFGVRLLDRFVAENYEG